MPSAELLGATSGVILDGQVHDIYNILGMRLEICGMDTFWIRLWTRPRDTSH